MKHTGRYCHSRSTTIDVYANDEEAYTNQNEEVEELLRDFMNWIYRQLEQEYEYLTSDEAIAETIRANEWKFRENGKIDY